MRSPQWHQIAAPRLAAVAFAAALGSACTALIEFRDEGGPTGADATAPTTSSSSSGGPIKTDAGAPDSKVSDARAPITDATPCVRPDGRALGNGVYCANNGTERWPNSNDLIYCENGGHTYRECNKCFKAPVGVPDICDECAAFADGKYCGDRMPITDDKTVEITCRDGAVAAVRECAQKCFQSPDTGIISCSPVPQ